MATKLFRTLHLFTCRNRPGNVLSERNSHCKVSGLHPDLENCFNNQITTEFFASFTYLAMATFFGRQNVSLMGCSKYFLNQVLEEREHAHKLIDYLNQRGSTVCFQTIPQPVNQSWDSPLAAFKDALELEKSVSQKLFDLHKMSEEYGDLCASNLLENDFLENQVEEYDRVSRFVAQLEQIGSDGLGIYVFDKYLLKDIKKEN